LIDRNYSFLKFLKNYSIHQLKKINPPEDHEKFFVGFGNFELEKKDLKFEYISTNYVYFVDGFGRIIWRATGKPNESDLEMLNKFLLD
jgi:hypothetical protein